MSRSRIGYVMLSLVAFAVILSTGCVSKPNRGTYDLYLIPDNYEGTIRVIYNVEGAPPLERDGKYDIIPVGKDGKYSTSNPMFDYGAVIDQYYYVDEAGNRKGIDRFCIHVRGTGGSSGNGTETYHTEIEITRSECGDDFMLHGSIAANPRTT